MNLVNRAARGRNQLFWLGLIYCTVYQSYRYPFQINSTLTSPTYSDTPLILQVGKFLIAIPLLVFALPRSFRVGLSVREWLLVTTILFLFAFAVVKAALGGGPGYLEPVFWMPFALAMACSSEVITFDEVDRYLRWLLVYSLLSTFVEVMLFVFLGRLPALAYEGSVSIRFGGFLDDPNGFAGVLFLLLGWSYGKYTGTRRKLVLLSLMTCLFLTQSWTAYGFFLVVAVAWGISSMKKRPIALTLSTALIAFVGTIALRKVPDSAILGFQTILYSKQQSAQGHAFPWSDMLPRWSEWLWFGQGTYIPYESWWAGALVNFGLPWLLIYLILCAWLTLSVGQAFKRAYGSHRSALLGLFIFVLYFDFGSINLPFPTVFPLNVILFMFAFPLMLGKMRPGSNITDLSLSPRTINKRLIYQRE